MARREVWRPASSGSAHARGNSPKWRPHDLEATNFISTRGVLHEPGGGGPGHQQGKGKRRRRRVRGRKYEEERGK